jgi:Major Facilitator Superfamily.
MTRGWRDSFAVYGDRRILAIFFFGFSSGLPLLLIKSGSTLGAWLTDAQVDLASITMLAWAGIPYSLKFLWAPFLDRLAPPPGFDRLGQRRGWMLLIQMALAGSIVLLGVTPADDTLMLGLAVLLVAFCSASQDVVVDAYRVDILTGEQQAPGATMVQGGYRIAMLVSGAGALALAEHFLTWPQVYMVMAALTAVGMAATLLNPEPRAAERAAVPATAGPWLRDAVLSPFADMIHRQGLALFGILAFIVLFKLCDAIPGSVATPFYKAMGFSNDEIAGISKVFGFGATLVGLALGGVVAVRLGLLRALFVTGVLQAVSNLMYVWQTAMGHDRLALIATIAVENVTGSMAAAVFVAYISRLCNLNYSATQYALLSALAALGTNFFAGFSGHLVKTMGWAPFFVFTTFTAIPGLLLLVWMMRRFPEPTGRPVAQSAE